MCRPCGPVHIERESVRETEIDIYIYVCVILKSRYIQPYLQQIPHDILIITPYIPSRVGLVSRFFIIVGYNPKKRRPNTLHHIIWNIQYSTSPLYDIISSRRISCHMPMHSNAEEILHRLMMALAIIDWIPAKKGGAAWSHQCLIQDVRAIGGCNALHALVAFETCRAKSQALRKCSK